MKVKSYINVQNAAVLNQQELIIVQFVKGKNDLIEIKNIKCFLFSFSLQEQKYVVISKNVGKKNIIFME